MHGRKQWILVYDENGEVVDRRLGYESCALAWYMTTASLKHRLDGKCKSAYWAYGKTYDFAREGDYENMAKARERAMNGHSPSAQNRKRAVKVLASGEIAETYPSLGECARANGLSRGCVSDHCNCKTTILNRWEHDYDVAFADDTKSILAAVRRLKAKAKLKAVTV